MIRITIEVLGSEASLQTERMAGSKGDQAAGGDDQSGSLAAGLRTAAAAGAMDGGPAPSGTDEVIGATRNEPARFEGDMQRGDDAISAGAAPA